MRRRLELGYFIMVQRSPATYNGWMKRNDCHFRVKSYMVFENLHELGTRAWDSQKSSFKNSVYLLTNQVLETRFLYREIEFLKLDFCTWNRTYESRFLSKEMGF